MKARREPHADEADGATVRAVLEGVGDGAGDERRMTRGVAGRESAPHFGTHDAVMAALDRQAIVAETDARGVITRVNAAFCRISGYSADELIGRTHRVLNARAHPPGFFAALWRTIAEGGIWHGEICNRRRDGALYWVDTTIVPRHGPTGRIAGYLSVRYDITERKRTEAALAEEVRRRTAAETLLREVIDAVPAGIAAFDPQDRLVLSNGAFRRLLGLGPATAIEGLDFREIVTRAAAQGRFLDVGRTPQAVEAWLDGLMRERVRPGRRRLRRLADGRWLQIRERRSPSGHRVSIGTDVTALKRAELAVRERAERDPLTGLHNRAAFGERLERLVGPGPRARPGALAILDLDGFKRVNDSFGHDVGDGLLREVAQRLAASIRPGDVVARLGGDEFAILMPGIASEAALERLLAGVLERLGLPVETTGRALFPRASVGCAFFPEHGACAREVLKAADLALYDVKAQRRAGAPRAEAPGGSARVYAPALGEREARRQGLVSGLREALAGHDISVALQPQVSLADGTHEGFEALARWRRAGAFVPPSLFIPVAEDANLIGAVGAVVLHEALAATRRLVDAGLEPGRIAVNVAAAQLRDAGFVDLVADALARHGLPASRLEVEITETVLLDRDAGTIVAALERLRGMGVGIALDDFGTGYASLSHLKRFPVDRLKIDRSFVDGIDRDDGARALVSGIVGLAHGLSLGVVAEGIETPRQRAILAGMGCDVGQGYLFAVPLAPENVADYLRRAGRAAGAGG
ncbi:putative bifunctional diguanylate cyclase/phosphodiesterase [Salinarimonas rosea]|uniref:putative bifunctional diguanylate cyclase/phosphodiesterase n=1 Tax=Salinarimonas rosea TaxID=552063 RepID=UPI000694F26D|nr:EAL domain-containing protein [Salinarimonas rosea]